MAVFWLFINRRRCSHKKLPHNMLKTPPKKETAKLNGFNTFRNLLGSMGILILLKSTISTDGTLMLQAICPFKNVKKKKEKPKIAPVKISANRLFVKMFRYPVS